MTDKTLEEILKPGGNWRYQMWIAPQDKSYGKGSLVYIVEDEKIIRRCAGNFKSVVDAQHFVRGFYEAQQELLNVEDEEQEDE